MTLVGLGRKGTPGKGSVLEQGEEAVGEAPPEPKDATTDVQTRALCSRGAESWPHVVSECSAPTASRACPEASAIP